MEKAPVIFHEQYSIRRLAVMTKKKSRSSARIGDARLDNLETVRHILLALPEVEEAVSRGSPVFRIKGKMIARLMEDGESLLLKVDYLKRDILINAEPATFYVTDFYRCYPMLLVRLSSVGRDVLGDLLEQAWRATASKRLIQAYDDKLAGR
jgi:hypothetical protein